MPILVPYSAKSLLQASLAQHQLAQHRRRPLAVGHSLQQRLSRAQRKHAGLMGLGVCSLSILLLFGGATGVLVALGDVSAQRAALRKDLPAEGALVGGSLAVPVHPAPHLGGDPGLEEHDFLLDDLQVGLNCVPPAAAEDPQRLRREGLQRALLPANHVLLYWLAVSDSQERFVHSRYSVSRQRGAKGLRCCRRSISFLSCYTWALLRRVLRLRLRSTLKGWLLGSCLSELPTSLVTLQMLGFGCNLLTLG